MQINAQNGEALRRASVSLPINHGSTKLSGVVQESNSPPEIILNTDHLPSSQLTTEAVPLPANTGHLSIADVHAIVQGNFKPNTTSPFQKVSDNLPIPEYKKLPEFLQESNSSAKTADADERAIGIAKGKLKFAVTSNKRTSPTPNRDSHLNSETVTTENDASWIGNLHEGKEMLGRINQKQNENKTIPIAGFSSITQNQAPSSILTNSGNALSRLKEDIRENSPKTESPKSHNNSPHAARRISKSLTPKHSPKHSPSSAQSSSNKQNANILLPPEISTGNVNYNIFHEDEPLDLQAYNAAQNPKNYDLELCKSLTEVLKQLPTPSSQRMENAVLSFCQETIKTLINEHLAIGYYKLFEPARISLLLDIIQKSGILFQDILPRLVAMRNTIAAKIMVSEEITDFSSELYLSLQKLTTIEKYLNSDQKMIHGKTIPPFLMEFKKILNWDCKQLQKDLNQHSKAHKKDYLYDPQIVKDYILEAVAGPWSDSYKPKEGMSTHTQKDVLLVSKEQKKDHTPSSHNVRDFINRIESIRSKESLYSEGQKDTALSPREKKKDNNSNSQIKASLKTDNRKSKEDVLLDAHQMIMDLEKWAIPSEGGLNKSTSQFTMLKEHCKKVADLTDAVSTLEHVEHHCLIEHHYRQPSKIEPTRNNTNGIGDHKPQINVSTKSLKFAAFKLSGETISAPFQLTVGDKEAPYTVNSTDIYQTSPATNPIRDVFRSFQDEKILPRLIVINNRTFYKNSDGVEPLVNFSPTNSAGIQNPSETIPWKWMSDDKVMNFLSNLSHTIYESGLNPKYRSYVREDMAKLKKYNDDPKLWHQEHCLKVKPPEPEEMFPWLNVAELMTIPCGGIGIITLVLLYPRLFPEYYPDKTAIDPDDKTAKDPDVAPKYHVTFPKGFLEHHIVIKNEFEYSVTQTNQYNICLKDSQVKLATLSTSLKNEPSTRSVNTRSWNSVFKVSCEVYNPEYWVDIMDIITSPNALSARSDIPSGLHYDLEVNIPRRKSKGGHSHS